MNRALAFLGLALAALLAAPAWALDPLPDVVQEPGYVEWTLPADQPMVRLEDALAGLRTSDPIRHEETLKALGFYREDRGRGEVAYPEFDEPIQATAQFLGFQRRKLAVLTAPELGRRRWYAVLLRQDGNGERPWRAFQVFRFETDPERGLPIAFPDILGDDIRFWEVKHIVQDDIFGRVQVATLFRYDEEGQMRRVFQEEDRAYITAKFMGHSLRLTETLEFPGDQSIRRRVTVESYPWMRNEEFEHYLDVPSSEAPPAKVIHFSERFTWDPADFDFYADSQELDKLLHARSEFVRRDAARRLGEHLKTAPRRMAEAVWRDKSPLVRIQVALALAAIGDPSALPSVDKALRNWNEDTAVIQALDLAKDRLERAKAASAQPAAPGAAPAGD